MATKRELIEHSISLEEAIESSPSPETGSMARFDFITDLVATEDALERLG